LPADDLTRIAGLSAEQAARLRTAGVTTYTRLAQLSPDELRMITLTPGGATADPAQWQVQARQLATVQSGGERV
jgi:predicted flap endonuclease-1-like 5' DNA nuclease